MPLIRAIVDLAHGLGLTVSLEGVETGHQLEVLAAAGCDRVQGYLIHKTAGGEPGGSCLPTIVAGTRPARMRFVTVLKPPDAHGALIKPLARDRFDADVSPR